jgi:lambda family phage portal protein
MLASALLGRPVASGFGVSGSGGYDAATPSRRLAGFVGSNASVNALLVGSGDELRSKSHKIVRENAWASGAIDGWTANAIGTGIKPQPRIKDAALKRQIVELWSDSVDEMDAAGVTDYYGLQALAWRTMMEGGEAFIRIRSRRPSDGLAVPIQFQVLEADHTPLNLMQRLENGNTVRAGIEFNAIGQRVAYWMYPEHPQSGITQFVSDNQPRRVPADQVIHLFAPTRPGQLRGEPWLTRALIKLWNLDQWDDATLERQKLGAMLLAWITENSPDGVDPLLASSRTLGMDNGSVTAPEGIEFGKLEPGTMLKMLMGEELNFFQPPDVGANYSNFNEAQQRWVAQATKALPYEDLTGDVSKVNYSSIRARNLAFRRICEQLQFSVMVFQFCRPVYNAWMDAAVLSGALNIPGYASNPRQFRRCNHRTPKWAWVDPLKDAQAEILLIDNLLKARSDVINEMGEDEDEVDARIAADQKREADAGLIRRGKVTPPGSATEEEAAAPPDDAVKQENG